MIGLAAGLCAGLIIMICLHGAGSVSYRGSRRYAPRHEMRTA